MLLPPIRTNTGRAFALSLCVCLLLAAGAGTGWTGSCAAGDAARCGPICCCHQASEATPSLALDRPDCCCEVEGDPGAGDRHPATMESASASGQQREQCSSSQLPVTPVATVPGPGKVGVRDLLGLAVAGAGPPSRIRLCSFLC
jgi:hypothetical protein